MRNRSTSALAIATLLPLLVTTAVRAQAEVVVASDNFNRADETPLVVDGNWQRFTPGGVANLAGNQVAGATSDALYYWQGSGVFDNARQFSRGRVTNAGGQVGLVLLGTSDQALVTAWGGGMLFIYSYAGGAYQGNLTTLSSTLQNGDFIEAVLDAGVITAKINGLVVATVANSTPLTSGRPGFETFQAGATLDDWAGGIPAGANQSNCGDGTVDPGEECDDGNNTNGDGCDSECVLEKCGDGTLDPGEECDDDNTTDGDGCDSECNIEVKCGDGTLDPGEECDDGNNTDGDGCSSECQDEEVSEGCTPGFWKNHHAQWQGFTPTQEVGSVFTGCSVFTSLADDSLDGALRYSGGSGVLGGARIMLRACTAALLNEAHDEVDYGADGVVGLCNTACATQNRNTMLGLGGLLDDANNDGLCPLSGGNTNTNKKKNGRESRYERRSH